MDLSNIPIGTAAGWVAGVLTLAIGQVARAKLNGKVPVQPCREHAVAIATLEEANKAIAAGLDRIETHVQAIANRELETLQEAAAMKKGRQC